MKKFLCALALALLSWAAVAQQASAATVLNFDSTVGPNAAFSIAHQFTFAGEQNGTFGAAANLNAVSGLLADICSDATCTGGSLFSAIGAPVGGLFSLAAGSFANLAAGTYYLVVSGLTSATPGIGSTYFASITLTPTVPVPPAILLFVTALGGLGLFGRLRRGKAAS